MLRQNQIIAEKQSRTEELAKATYLYEMGLKPKTKDRKDRRVQ